MQSFQEKSAKHVYIEIARNCMERHRLTIISMVKIFIIYFERQLEKEFFKGI